MKTLCISCTKADLRNAKVRLSGTVRGENYTIEMYGLECPNCGYRTVDGRSMSEFGRLLADEYRRAHDLLTSDDIVALRRQFRDNQEAFAKRVGVGVASIKRWELGKIQDERNNKLILEQTRPQVAFIMTGITNGSTIGSSVWGTVIGSGTATGFCGTTVPVHSCNDSLLYNDNLNAQMYGRSNSSATAGECKLVATPEATALAREILEFPQLGRGSYGR